MINSNDFKTKTYLKRRGNIGSEKAWIVALDIGYSAVKAMSKSGMFSFPSFAVRRSEDSISVGEPTANDIQYRDESGVIWDVGEMAISRIQQNDNSNTEEMLYSRNRYNNPMFLVLARTGVALGLQNMTPFGSKLILQTGLPPAYLKSDSKILKKVLIGKHEFHLKIGNGAWKKYVFELNDGNIKIMGQPMGSLFSATYKDNGREIDNAKQFLSSNGLIFDGGFGTLDTFEIRNRSIGAMQTFDHLGMKAVLHRAADIIYKQYDVEIAVSAMQNNLGWGHFTKFDPDTVSTQKIDINGIIESASREICMEAISQIRQIYNNLIDYKYLLITGGTGDAWLKTIKEYFSKMEGLEIISANRNTDIPQIFSNVRGYYLYCVNKTDRS